MPTVTEKTIDAWASCSDALCAGHKQEPVKAIETLTEFTYFDLGGDIPGVERSTTLLRFADLADVQCEHCGEPRFVADQVRPIYPNMSGQPQDMLLQMHKGGERIRDMELAEAKRDAEMAQMRATMERQQNLIERLIGQETPAPAPARRTRKVDDSE